MKDAHKKCNKCIDFAQTVETPYLKIMIISHAKEILKNNQEKSILALNLDNFTRLLFKEKKMVKTRMISNRWKHKLKNS